MNEKPILFNAEMVRAILEGRKTQTRRPIKGMVDLSCLEYRPQLDKEELIFEHNPKCEGYCYYECGGKWHKSPFLTYHESETTLYIEEGEHQLWVRETFYRLYHGDSYCSWIPTNEFSYVDQPKPATSLHMKEWRRISSRHMPRHASRINLKVKRVWVERIQDISEEDCVKEGIPTVELSIGIAYRNLNSNISYQNPKTPFRDLWESCGYDWESNPFVWCCEFEVMECD